MPIETAAPSAPDETSRLAAIRAVVPTLEEDRYMAPDLEAASRLVSSGVLGAAVSMGILPGLEG